MSDYSHHTPRLLTDEDAAADLAGVARPSLPSVSIALETALNRIEDMLSDDDGQAFKEARKFLPVGRALAAQPVSVGDMVMVPAEIVNRFPEINPGNYDYDDACALNAWGVELVLAAAPTEEKPAQQDAVDAALAYLDDLKDDAIAHIWPDDLQRCQTSECVVQVASVRMGSPDGMTVPLFSREQVADAIRAAISAKKVGA